MNSRLFSFFLVVAAIAATPINEASAQAVLTAPAVVSQAPSAYPRASQPGPVKRVRRIVLDAGHGGRDFGALTSDGRREKDLALEMTLRLRDRLRAAGHEVILTRGSDVFVPLPARANVANKKRADLFVSLHGNASTSASLRGFEVYYLSDEISDEGMAVERAANSSFPSETAKFAGDSQGVRQIAWELRSAANRAQSREGARRIADAVDHRCEIWTKRLRAAKFQVLIRTECPAVLVEVGYLTNADDRKLLDDEAYKITMVDAIAEGILNFRDDFEATGGFAS
jgi:N-acetylmuramoyl-L-alanine amidase